MKNIKFPLLQILVGIFPNDCRNILPLNYALQDFIANLALPSDHSHKPIDYHQ